MKKRTHKKRKKEEEEGTELLFLPKLVVPD
jgi:hypothetical protein